MDSQVLQINAGSGGLVKGARTGNWSVFDANRETTPAHHLSLLSLRCQWERERDSERGHTPYFGPSPLDGHAGRFLVPPDDIRLPPPRELPLSLLARAGASRNASLTAGHSIESASARVPPKQDPPQNHHIALRLADTLATPFFSRLLILIAILSVSSARIRVEVIELQSGTWVRPPPPPVPIISVGSGH
ncbi:uncharacterized protein CIMG_13749 [Coccidioides immitis RS]|uniref:Uncharacterized protein n=1 Tax=Coccidioides immitis (strain RS) TaxID=246410 RepID=A0A0D8JW84_COCIM|nr:uncharacterized protein CIMG_13749 [Coccidioides immitis RS]KJF61577.1 hypothetical protein CIMG_13749 [Coccidioides immitis RS]